MKKRAVILLGAGAAKAWEAALTPQITQLILGDNIFQTRAHQGLAEYLRDQLIIFHQCPPEEVNFETIINTLENLIDYFRMKAYDNSNPNEASSISHWLDTNALVDQMMNFQFDPHGYIGGHGTVINLVNGNPTINVHPKLAEAAYLSEAIKHYMLLIKNEVAKYCEGSRDPKFNGVNAKLKDFILYLIANNYSPRFYTTNYDCLLPKIFSGDPLINFFDGSEDQIQIDPFPQYSFTTQKIFNDRDCLSYYNLHGSIYWTVARNFLNGKERFVCQPDVANIYSYDTLRTMTNPGTDTIIYNIVTGYNKLQRISVEPLNAFHSSFALDCNNADIIITVGYSFSDYHLNRSINDGIRSKDSRLLHITYCATDYLQSKDYHKIEYDILEFKNDFHPATLNGAWVNSKNNFQIVYKEGFEKYLMAEEWKNSYL